MAASFQNIEGPFYEGEEGAVYFADLVVTGGTTTLNDSTSIPGEIIRAPLGLPPTVGLVLTSNYPKPSTQAFTVLVDGTYRLKYRTRI